MLPCRWKSEITSNLKETQLNNLETRETELNRRWDALVARSQTDNSPVILTEMKQVHAEFDALEIDKKSFKAREAAIAKIDGSAKGAGSYQPEKKALTGKQVSPLAFSETKLKEMHRAFQNRQSYSIQAKGFSTVESLLPAELEPGVVEHIHEWRILDRLPARAVDAPTVEFIVHNFAGDTGTLGSAPFAGPVAEGAAKPEYVPDATSSIATIVKLAMHTGISYETLADYRDWLGYIQSESMRQVMDAENAQLLYGSGSSGNMLGLANVSGILTHNCSSDPGGYAPLDSVEVSINALRIGNALAEPNLFITHPTTWSSMRRTKSTTNEYILGDPLHDAVQSLWGIPVLITTAVTAGEGFLLDTTKFGTALIREGIVMHQGFSGTDFIDNIVRYVFETRLALAVERPQAVLLLSNLPTS
jgi:HK97 family phage major capsid protein